MNYLNGKLLKKNGTLELNGVAFRKLYDEFVNALPENQVVEVFYEILQDDGSLPQLAKLHVIIRQLAHHVGETVDNMKLLVKERAGLCIIREVSGKEFFLAKSFSECSREELSLAIQACMEIGEEVRMLVG